MEYDIDTLVQHFQKKGPVVLLESQSSDHPASSVSYLAAQPKTTIRAYGQEVVIEEGGDKKVVQANPWDALSSFYNSHSDWMFGYLGYDLKNSIEVLYSRNPDHVQAPDFFFMVPEFLLKINRDSNTLEVIKGELPQGINLSAGNLPKPGLGPIEYAVKQDRYLETIREAQRRISEGDFYEINLSHQLHTTFRGNAFSLYRLMKDVGPVPFGAFVSFDGFSICSMSPERFLGKSENRVFSQPIKGTVKRGDSSEEDDRLRSKLKSSLKNRAENLMVVDLVRNDLSRIAREGTVKVSNLFQIQTFGTVHQMVSTIEAESIEKNPVEIIKACYPMGSMTGAPKISAMKAIEELENYRRGVYSGAIGYLQPNSDFDFNVVIRTAIIKEGNLFYSIGGAITGDSDPGEEWDETLVKAQALTNTIS